MKRKIISSLVVIIVALIAMGSMIVQAAEVTGKTWIFPVSNYTSIGCRYGCNCSVHKGSHPGNDIRASKNTMVLATRSGTVEAYRNTCDGSHWADLKECSCSSGKLTGNYVKIKHTDGSFTVYYHMNTACVKTGDWVDQGDIIGYIGRTGNASGYHTCFEYHNKNDKSTSFVDTIVDNNKAVNGSTTYLMTLRSADKNIGIYEKPSTSSTKLATIVQGTKVLCRVIQENYGFVEYDGVTGWVYLPNTTKVSYAFQLDYYKNEGTGKMSNTTHVAGDDIALPKNNFKRSGYMFGGWRAYRPYDNKWFYKNADGTDYGWYVYNEQPVGWSRHVFYDGEVIPGELFADITGRQVLRMTAIWVDEDAITYTVRYLPEGGRGTMSDTAGTKGVADSIAVCNFAMDGYMFAGWTASRESDGKWLYKNAEGTATWYLLGEAPEGYKLGRYADGSTTTSPTAVDGDIIYLHAQWTTDGIIWLEPGNGEAKYTRYVQDGETIGELPIPQRKGYYFIGWYTQEEGGTQIISLNAAQDMSGINTLYAHWLPHSERSYTEDYIQRTSSGNQYILALSQLLSASCQQSNDFTTDECYALLDSVGMISSSENVYNGRFVTSGFLEYYAPELTWYGESYICNSYSEYVSNLSEMMHEGYYIMVKLDIDGTHTAWRYLYDADGESLVVVHNGELIDVEDIAQGIVSSNLFLYHGTLHTVSNNFGGTYEYVTEEDLTQLCIALDYTRTELSVKKKYKLWIAYYSDEGQLLCCKQKTIELDNDMSVEFVTECPEKFEEIRVYTMENDLKPQCEDIALTCSNP